jgi:late competence protein required for DNA uptake (superfamily II DNA/RNA helicase)
MVNCERCKQKITLSNIYIDKETGNAKKYCRACAELVKNEEKNNMPVKKENEEPIQDFPKEVQHLEKLSKSVTDAKSDTDIVTRDMLIDRINSYLGEEPLNMGEGDFCYIRIIGNHLEIGRAKVVFEE